MVSHLEMSCTPWRSMPTGKVLVAIAWEIAINDFWKSPVEQLYIYRNIVMADITKSLTYVATYVYRFYCISYRSYRTKCYVCIINHMALLPPLQCN